MDFKLDFIGIGAPKAGTTQVAEWLEAHPGVCMSVPKEIHYFNERSSYIHPQPNPNSLQPLSWYAKHFNHYKKGQLKGEFSTGYMYDAHCAEKIKAHNPDMKIIACLRQPAERAYSQYVMFRYYFKMEERPFSEMMFEGNEFIEKSLYYKQLKRYFDVFDKAQIHIVFLEDLKNDAEKACTDLYDFIGVDTLFVPPNLHGKANASKAVKFKFVSKLMGQFSKLMVGLGLSGLVEKLKQSGLKKWVMGMNSSPIKYPPMSEEERAYIMNAVSDDLVQLEELLGKDLGHWKT